jgi:hypothetical protein
MVRWLGSLALVASLVLLVGAASAGDDAGKKKKGGKGGAGKLIGTDPEATFKKLDANGDGKLTKDEFLKIADKIKDTDKASKAKEFLGKAFDKISNGESSVTLDQFKKAATELGKKKKKKAAE